MTSLSGWYYLHTNGDLIFKRFQPEIDPGGFVRMVWPCDPSSRLDAWIIAIEALALGARRERSIRGRRKDRNRSRA